MNVGRTLAAALAVALLSLPALGLARTAAPPQLTGAQTTLRLTMPDESPTVDPARAADEADVQLADLLFVGLVRLDQHYRVVPSAAQSWTVSPDHRTYTFVLRKGMHFSNGDPLTAKDFAYSIRRSLDPSLGSPSAPTYLLDIEGAESVLLGKSTTLSGVKVLSDTRLQITARWPVPYFLMELTYPTSFAVDRRQLTRPDDSSWYANPSSSGPYRIQSWSPGNLITLVPNPHFWQPASVKISIALGPFPASGLYSYVTRQFDVAGLPPDAVGLLKRRGVHETDMLGINGVYIDFRHKPYGNLLVRRALTLALDRARLVNEALGASGTPFGGYVPPGESGYDPHLNVLPYNPGAARSALAASGYSPSHFPTLTLYYAEDPNDATTTRLTARLANAIAKSWHSVLKIDATAQPLIVNALLAKVESHSLPVYLAGWSANYPDPHDWLSGQWRSDSVNNNVHFAYARFDTLVKTADVTWNKTQRMGLYNQAQQVLVDQAAWIPLYLPHRIVYIRPGVANLALTGYGLIPQNGNWAGLSIATTQPSTHRQ